MEYNGMTLTEYDLSVWKVFNPPKKMLVWDDDSMRCEKAEVLAIIPNRESYPVIARQQTWMHCAEIPDRVTHLQLARWLAEGKGQVLYGGGRLPTTNYSYGLGEDAKPVPKDVQVRKWGDTEWHEPTLEYMGIGG